MWMRGKDVNNESIIAGNIQSYMQLLSLINPILGILLDKYGKRPHYAVKGFALIMFAFITWLLV